MATTIPFQDGFLLGRSIDMRSFQVGSVLLDETTTPQPVQGNQTEARFTFLNTVQDACDVMRVPFEYILKAQINKIDCPVLPLLLSGMEEKYSFTVAFKASFLQQKQYLPEDAIPKRSRAQKVVQGAKPLNTDEDTKDAGADPVEEGYDVVDPNKEESLSSGASDNPTSVKDEEGKKNESLIREAIEDLGPLEPQVETGPSESGTHWVRAVEIGNELLIIVRIFATDSDADEKFFKIYNRLKNVLSDPKGPLDEDKLKCLLKESQEIDLKLKKKAYSNFKLEIHYCSPKPQANRPGTLAGMVRVLQTYIDQMTGWAGMDWSKEEGEPQPARVVCLPAFADNEVPPPESGGVNFSADHKNAGFKADHGSSSTDNEGDSFVQIEPIRFTDFFKIRVTLEPFEEEFDNDLGADSLNRSLAMLQFPEDTSNRFSQIFHLLKDCLKAVNKIQEFISSKRFAMDSRVQQVNGILKSVQGCHFAVHELISSLDFVSVPSETAVGELLESNPLKTVILYIQEVMSTLPPGGDLDLLLMGKTGHGKSATGNSILSDRRFLESADEHSMTQEIDFGSASIDGRRIKIVDMPGVCDTNHEGYDDSIEMGIHCVSEAIAKITSGFHALLLVFSYGSRISLEERKAFELLKRLLGEDIIKTHTVVIITSGDRFKQENPNMAFSDWCHSRTGFLKDLFEECDYRCVLFNNKEQEPRRKKRQLIALVNQIDRMGGTRYTSSLFQLALDAEERARKELNMPDISEEMMKELEILQGDLARLDRKGGKLEESDKHDLVVLKGRLDRLNEELKSGQAEQSQMAPLVKTLLSLANTVHSRLDYIANAPNSQVMHSPATISHSTQEDSGDAPSQQIVEFKQDAVDLSSFVNEVKEKQGKVKKRVTHKVKEDVKSKDGGCFSATAQVCLASGETVSLEDIKVGDKVLSLDAKGQYIYDTVYMFGHREPGVWSTFVVLETTEGRSLKLTANHLVFCQRDGVQLMLPAGKLCAGDFVLTSSGPDADLTELQCKVEMVTRIGWEGSRGLFAPFTLSGRLFVNGVLASCYIDVLTPEISHAMMGLMRQLYRISPQCLEAVNGSDPVPGWAKTMLKLL